MFEKLAEPNTKQRVEVNEELIQKLLEWSDEGIYEYDMAERLNITPQHFSRLKSQYPALKELDLKKRCEESREDRATKAMWQMIERMDKQSASLIMFYLKCKCGWTEKRTLEVTTVETEKPSTEGLTKEQIAKAYNDFFKNN